jgi:hypothetical protein
MLSLTETLQKLLKELKSATHLSYLHLPGASSLGLGYDGGADCGNAYFGPGGRKYGRQVSKEKTEQIERAARMVFDVLPHLKSISIGNVSPMDIQRDEDGNVVKLKWEWSGRMHDYLYELWPEPEEGSANYNLW